MMIAPATLAVACGKLKDMANGSGIKSDMF